MDSLTHFDESKPNFANLPLEIIFQILSYLNYGDKNAASQTCIRWLEASVEYFFHVKICFSKVCLSDDSYPAQIFINTNQPYKNLELVDVVLCQSSNFFQKLGKSINKISFVTLDFDEKQFCLIICNLEHLTDLIIENNSPLFMSGQFLESEKSRNAIKKNMAKLNVLSLENNPYLCDAILMRIIELTQHLKVLNLSNCHMACHSAIQKRFYPLHLKNTPSESILTLKYVLKAIETQARTLIDLNLSDTLVDGAALSVIAEIKNLNLQKVTLKFCRQLNINGLQGFINYQHNIKEFDLSNSVGINDSCIELISGLTKLESLRLSHCYKLTDQTTKILVNLKKIKILDLSYCVGISSNGIEENFVKERNEILLELYLSSIDLYENCVIHLAKNLPNLRVFDISNCRNGVTDKSLKAIIKNQIWLRNLNLQSCHLITDAGITGCNLDNFIKENELSGEIIKDNGNSTDFLKPVKISLRSKAEKQIVEEAERAKTMLSLLNKNLNIVIKEDNKSLSNLKGLEVLNLSGCTKISDISFKYGLKFHELRKLDISNCQQISIMGIKCLVENCSSIEVLNLSFCQNLNQEVIDILETNLKRLKVLNSVGCTLD